MRHTDRLLVLTLALGSALFVAGCAETKSGAAAGGVAAGELGPMEPDSVLATADGITITGKEATEATRTEAFQAQKKLFEARKMWVENELAKRLVEREAKKQDMSLEEFLEKKIETDVKVTDSDVQMFYRSNPQMMRKPDGSVATMDEVGPKIREYLVAQSAGKKRSEYIKTLMDDANYKISMEPPEPPTVEVAAGDNPSKGPEDAPVTIIEFSDFQCPACRQADVQILDVLAKYEGKVRLVYRDFPLNNHAQAIPAAVAASCARDQGKYWEYHEGLFKGQRQLGAEKYQSLAEELELDKDKFNACLADESRVKPVLEDLEAGEKAGVNSTPTFFVNGKIVSGANIPELTRLIEAELKKAGRS